MAGAAAGSPAGEPIITDCEGRSMYVCLCHAITDQHIRTAVAERGARTMRDLRQELGLCACCGRCGNEALEVLQRARNTFLASEVRIELSPIEAASRVNGAYCADCAGQEDQEGLDAALLHDESVTHSIAKGESASSIVRREPGSPAGERQIHGEGARPSECRKRQPGQQR